MGRTSNAYFLAVLFLIQQRETNKKKNWRDLRTVAQKENYLSFHLERLTCLSRLLGCAMLKLRCGTLTDNKYIQPFVKF